MRFRPDQKKEKIQSRHIDVSTYEYDDDHIVVSGELIDKRLVSTYDLSGNHRPPLTVHHLRVEWLLSLKDRNILFIQVDMAETPHEECARIEKSLEKLEGAVIEPGFTRQVKKLFGGRKGCIHLTTLLLAMAPAALQGYWTHSDRNPKKGDISRTAVEHYLVDSCHVWREDGPLIDKIADRIR